MSVVSKAGKKLRLNIQSIYENYHLNTCRLVVPLFFLNQQENLICIFNVCVLRSGFITFSHTITLV